MTAPQLEIIHTGFETRSWQVAIDGRYLRTARGKIRCFATDTAAHRALRQVIRLAGMEYSIPHERHERPGPVACVSRMRSAKRTDNG